MRLHCLSGGRFGEATAVSYLLKTPNSRAANGEGNAEFPETKPENKQYVDVEHGVTKESTTGGCIQNGSVAKIEQESVFVSSLTFDQRNLAI